MGMRLGISCQAKDRDINRENIIFIDSVNTTSRHVVFEQGERTAPSPLRPLGHRPIDPLTQLPNSNPIPSHLIHLRGGGGDDGISDQPAANPTER